MQLVRDPDRLRAATRRRVLAVGSFDGVHLGHQRVLRQLHDLAAERGADAVVALQPCRQVAPALTSLGQRVRLITALGTDCILALRRTASSDPMTLALRTGADLLVSGDPGLPAGPVVVARVPPVCVDGAPVAASHIADRLAAGDLAGATRALGRAPTIEGRVIHGHHRGAPLGIPTANLRLRDIVLPSDGVYAVRARWQGSELLGVANIGFNPTFGNRTRSVEVHLLDFAADLYGQRLEVAFVARVRGERKFAGIDALLEQIRADIAAARAALTSADHE